MSYVGIMIDAESACEILGWIEDRGIEVWVDGGWGVDALLGECTRDHADFDLILRSHDLATVEELLFAAGYRRTQSDSSTNFVLADDSGRRVDVHGIEFDERGFGCFPLPDGRVWPMPPAAFAGRGRIAGRSFRCLSAEAQVQCHAQGYEPTESDLHDMEKLQERFEVILPLALCRQKTVRRSAADRAREEPYPERVNGQPLRMESGVEEQIIDITTYIRSDPKTIWTALTNPDITEKYWGNSRIESDWKSGSKIRYRRGGEIMDEHTILEIVPERRLVHTFKPLFGEYKDEVPSRVCIEVLPLGPVCKLSVRHDQFQPGSKVFEACSNGWPVILSGLKTLLETGTALPDFAFADQADGSESAR